MNYKIAIYISFDLNQKSLKNEDKRLPDYRIFSRFPLASVSKRSMQTVNGLGHSSLSTNDTCLLVHKLRSTDTMGSYKRRIGEHLVSSQNSTNDKSRSNTLSSFAIYDIPLNSLLPREEFKDLPSSAHRPDTARSAWHRRPKRTRSESTIPVR